MSNAVITAPSTAPVTVESDWVDRQAYPFVDRWFDGPDGLQHYVDEGSGEPLLLVHGTPTWSFEWRHLIRAFAHDYRVIAPDHLGFGLSEQPRHADYTPAGHARRFAAFARALDLQHVTLVVHDYGGPFALPWALDHPLSVHRLIVLNSWMWPFDDDPMMSRRARIAASGLGRWMYRWGNASLRWIAPGAYGDRSRLTPEIHEQYLIPFRERWTRSDILWVLARALLQSSDHFRSIWQGRASLARLPSLIVWGLDDGAFPPYLLNRWREALPRAQITALTGTGHWPHEEAPDAVIDAMKAFLEL